MSTVESAAEPAVSEPPDLGDAFVVRVATAYLVVDPGHAGGKPDLGLAKRLRDSLNEDPRVLSVDVPAMDPGWSPHVYAYPAMEGPEDDAGVIEGTRHVHYQQFSEAIGLHIHVPEKNQRRVFHDDEIPSEDYFVLWNGQSLLVAWRQPAEAPMSSSGGHVIESILEEATGRINAEVYFQGCNPGCDFLFVHTDIFALFSPAADDWAHMYDERHNLLFVTIPDEGGVEEAARRAWSRYRSALRDFADMKNLGRHIIDLEAVIRRDLDKLNSLHHQRAQASQGGIRERALAPWRFRGWRRKSRYYLARLWLALGSLESLQRRWAEERRNFARTTREAEIEDLFRIDSSDEIEALRELDASLIEASIQHAASRLDTSAVIYATVGGGIAGAVAAALITLL